LVLSFAGLVATGAAGNTYVVGPVFCSGVGELCTNIATINIHVAGGFGRAKYHPGPLACSAVRIHFFIDGNEVAVTSFAGPGEKTPFVSLGFVTSGTHTVGVQAEGEVGGCNIGGLFSWGGTVILEKSP